MINPYEQQFIELIEGGRIHLSNIKPSAWIEQNRVMTSDVSPFPGRFSFNKTPYLKEVVDCLSPDHPARKIAVMKGAQIGFSTGVIEGGIGWIIANNPGNILFLTGHADLAEEAMTSKIDQMIDSCGLRPLIRPNALRAKNMRTGDTNKSKEFPGGSLTSGAAGNHKLLRQRSVMYGFMDDLDAAKKSSAESGSTIGLIEQRFAAYSDKMKLYYISTPEQKKLSNIEPVYLLGDQRRYTIPCPCCCDYIWLEWEISIDGTEGKEKGGIYYELDNHNKLIESSVGYVCQSCAGFFNDSKKYELNLAGIWKPTAEPSEPGYFSYHISSLYAPPGMYDWQHYVKTYLKAVPPNGKRNEAEYKTFINTGLGLTYEEQGKELKANELQKNIRSYEVGIVPESLSIKDGNGKIVLLTLACDLNGTEEDARLDYEIIGWSQSGTSYSIDQGSIGTFVPRENDMKVKEDRERWTYHFNRSNSVWPRLLEIIDTKYKVDTGRNMSVFISGVDCGYFTNFAYQFIDNYSQNRTIVGLKGKDTEKFFRFSADKAAFHKAKERPNLYLVEVNMVKDTLSEYMGLRWNKSNEQFQPANFMNYPTPSAGKYLYKSFFMHYEAEKRVTETKEGESIGARWVKKTAVSQNHFWDVRVYNLILKDILIYFVEQEYKVKNLTWKDFVDAVLKSA